MSEAGTAIDRPYVIRYRDAHGFLQELSVTRADALAIRRIRATHRRAEEKWERQHVNFTDLSTDRNADQKVEHGTGRLRKSQQGNPWEGERYAFAHLIGESRTWHGEPIVRGWCTFCNRARLTIEQYCLGCDRCGRDLVIPLPTKADFKRLNRYQPKDDGLKGGKD